MSFLSSTDLLELRQPADNAACDLPVSCAPAAPEVLVPPASGPEPGRVLLDADLLRELRRTRLLSQQDLADECWRRNIRVSIATIKRAEAGRAVRFRIARELGRCFGLPPMQIVRA